VRVVQAAVALADAEGAPVATISMRKVAGALGVVPMALYKHVVDKDDLVDGMVDAVVGEFGSPRPGSGWKRAVRTQVLAARRVLQRHPWARHAIETRTKRTPAVLAYMDAIADLFRAGGFSDDLTHHVMHVLGNRIWGFSPELFAAPAGGERCDEQFEFEFALDLLLDGFERLHDAGWTSARARRRRRG
jgi:AcrR family transcriptional regulator